MPTMKVVGIRILMIVLKPQIYGVGEGQASKQPV